MDKKINLSHLEIEESKQILSPFIKANYNEMERPNQFKLNMRIMNKIYKNKEEIGYEMEKYAAESRYNLKLLRLKNRSNVTFVCSCSCKGKTETDTNLKDEKDQKLNNLKQSKSSIQTKYRRENLNSCLFRIKFEYNQIGEFVFNGLKVHNHNPYTVDAVSINLFIYYLRNLT